MFFCSHKISISSCEDTLVFSCPGLQQVTEEIAKLFVSSAMESHDSVGPSKNILHFLKAMHSA